MNFAHFIQHRFLRAPFLSHPCMHTCRPSAKFSAEIQLSSSKAGTTFPRAWPATGSCISQREQGVSRGEAATGWGVPAASPITLCPMQPPPSPHLWGSRHLPMTDSLNQRELLPEERRWRQPSPSTHAALAEHARGRAPTHTSALLTCCCLQIK